MYLCNKHSSKCFNYIRCLLFIIQGDRQSIIIITLQMRKPKHREDN